MDLCEYCAEALRPEELRCPHCGELRDAAAALEYRLQGVAPDPELSAKLPGWPDEQVRRALRDYREHYTPAQLVALAQTARSRGIEDVAEKPPPSVLGLFIGRMFAAVLFVLAALVAIPCLFALLRR